MNNSKGRYELPIIVIYPIGQLISIGLILLDKYGIFDEIFYPRFKRRTDTIIRSQIEMSNTSNLPQESDPNNANAGARDLGRSNSASSIFENNTSLKKAFKDKKFICLFMALFFGIGSTLGNLTNVNFILKAVSDKVNFTGLNKGIISIFKAKEAFFCVLLYISANVLIRVISGPLLSALNKQKKGFLYFMLFTLLGFISQFIGIFSNKSGLCASMVFAGAAHGGYMVFVPTFVQREFGSLHMGKIIGALMIGAALGTLLIGEIIFTTKTNSQGISKECSGSGCYRGSYIGSTLFFGINFVLGYQLK